ncbi:uncharacterized protein [Nicotiana sylvestris]|uniref:uncharacterized protein n=1 Tax=Nicotiana sylvestris TaxID=4096 RepID=UPI00388C8672
MTTIFHDMIHKEIGVYVNDVIIKSKKQSDHVKYLRKFFQRLRRYNLKLNPAKCAFGILSGKLLGLVVSRRDIELDSSKIKSIQELPLLKNKTELLKKNVAVKWTDECREAFDKIKRYLSNPPMLVPPEPERPLILYLTVLDNSFGCVLDQHDITRKNEQAIYYLSKKFTPYEFRSVEFRHIPRIHNEIVDALATLASMLHHPNKAYVDPVHIQVHDQHAYCNVVEEEIDDEPWFHDIKEYIRSGVYPIHATGDQKRTIRRLASGFFMSGGILYKRTPDLGLLRLEQLSLIDEKRLAAVCHGQLYQKRMARAYNKKVRPQKFEVGQMVLKRILPHQAEAKGKFSPNWQGAFIVTRVLPNGALYLTDIEGKCVDMAINSDAVKRYYV